MFGRSLAEANGGFKNMTHLELEGLVREHFGLPVVETVRQLDAGHINESAVVRTEDGDVVVQQLSTVAFTDPGAVMGNIELILERLLERNLSSLRFLRAVDGSWLAESGGRYWRCYRYLDGGATPPITTPEGAQSTARAFGRYAHAIDGLGLVEHVKGYHDFDRRIADLESAIATDSANRLGACEEVVAGLLATVDRVRLSSGFDAWREVPVRNVHNDAKGPNCVVGPTGARTVIDLDTTMPGTVLSDIGELVRSSTRHLLGATPAQLMSQIEAVNRGFLAAFRDPLEEAERQAMLLAGPLLTVENAGRFLADHLEGDIYYGVETAGENLDRAKVQLALAGRLIEAVEWATLG